MGVVSMIMIEMLVLIMDGLGLSREDPSISCQDYDVPDTVALKNDITMEVIRILHSMYQEKTGQLAKGLAGEATGGIRREGGGNRRLCSTSAMLTLYPASDMIL